VPVTQQRFVDGAARRAADAIILDLEDSVRRQRGCRSA
jgi:citrate lyase beta subunit